MQRFLNVIWAAIALPLMAHTLLVPVCSAQTPATKELSDTKPHDGEAVWRQQAPTARAAWGTTDVRYAKYSVPQGLSNRWEGRAWRGERINAQAVVYTPQKLTDVTVEASDLKAGKHTISASNIEVSYVYYVMTDELNKDGKSGCSDRPDKTQWDSSIVADRLQAAQAVDIEARSVRPVWLHIQIPRDAAPGTYRGTLRIAGNGLTTQTLPYTVNVSARTLTRPDQWPFHLDLWQNPYSIARYFDVPLWSEQFFEKARPLITRLANTGQKVITTTMIDKAWNGQTEDPFGSMVMKLKRIDGSWQYDYTVFDRWVEFVMSCGIREQINCYTLVPWALNFDYFDQATGRVRYVHASPAEQAFEDYWLPFLQDLARHLKERGWFTRFTIAMDERPMEAMEGALRVIHKADPAYKVSGAIHYYPTIEPQIYDLCLNYGETLPDSVLQRRQKEGKITTYYTCCAEAYPNTFSFSQPAEAEWIPWHSMAIGVDGYLRWAYNSWTASPLQDSRFRTWAAGDCYLVYPEGSSIRFERLVEGLQDAEKIRLLREEFLKNKKTAQLKKLNETVGKFIPENLNGKNATEMVKAGRKVLNSF